MSTAPVLQIAPRLVGPRLEVDLGAVAANTRFLAGRATGDLMAVVKADGFGHGAVEVARTALGHGASWLGVATIPEALQLRAAGLTAPVLSWLNPLDADWSRAVGAEVDLAVSSREQLDAVLGCTIGARVHLRLDTGMARDGAAPSEWAALCRVARAAERAGRVRVVGMMGHLPCADEPAHPANGLGRTRFAWGLMTARAAGLRPHARHLAATSATVLDPLSHHTMSRVGAGLVGIDPSRRLPAGTLRGALRLTAPLVEVRTVRAGTSVGYGHTWTAARTTRLGLVPLGYADGLPRLASAGAEVGVAGSRCAVAGRISMDMTVVDLGSTSAQVGDEVVLIGHGDGEPTVREWADWSGLLEHEVLTGLGRARVTRMVARRADVRSLS